MGSVLTLPSRTGHRHSSLPRRTVTSPMIGRLAATYERSANKPTQTAVFEGQSALPPPPPIEVSSSGPPVRDRVHAFQAGGPAEVELDRSQGSVRMVLDGMSTRNDYPGSPATPSPAPPSRSLNRPLPATPTLASGASSRLIGASTTPSILAPTPTTSFQTPSSSPSTRHAISRTTSNHSAHSSPWTAPARSSIKQVSPTASRVSHSQSLQVGLLWPAPHRDEVEEIEALVEGMPVRRAGSGSGSDVGATGGASADDSADLGTAMVATGVRVEGHGLARLTSLTELFGAQLAEPRSAEYLAKLAAVQTFLTSAITTAPDCSLPLWDDSTTPADFEDSLRSGFALAHLARSLGGDAFSQERRPIDRCTPLSNLRIFLDFARAAGVSGDRLFDEGRLYEGEEGEVEVAVECVHALMGSVGVDDRGGMAQSEREQEQEAELTAESITPDNLPLGSKNPVHQRHTTLSATTALDQAFTTALTDLNAEISNVSAALDDLCQALGDRVEQDEWEHSVYNRSLEAEQARQQAEQVEREQAQAKARAQARARRAAARKRQGRVWTAYHVSPRQAELARELEADGRRKTWDAARFDKLEAEHTAREALKSEADRKRRLGAAFEAELALGPVLATPSDLALGGRTRGHLVREQFADTLSALRDGPESLSPGATDAWDRRVCGRVMTDLQMLRLLAEAVLGEGEGQRGRVPEASEVDALAGLDLVALEFELERWFARGLWARWAGLMGAWLGKVLMVQARVRDGLAWQRAAEEKVTSIDFDKLGADIRRQSTVRTKSTRSSLRVSLSVPADAASSPRRTSRLFSVDRHAEKRREVAALEQQVKEGSAELAKREGELQLLRFRVDLLRGDNKAAMRSCPQGYIIAVVRPDKLKGVLSPQLSVPSLGTTWSDACSSKYDLRAQATSLRSTIARLELQLAATSSSIGDFTRYTRQHLLATHLAAASRPRRASPWSVQGRHLEDAREWRRAAKFGSFAYSVRSLEGKGVVVGMRKWTARGWEQGIVVLSCREAGLYRIEVGAPRGAVAGVEVGLIDLLERQFGQESQWHLDDVATFNLAKLIDLLKHKFMA